MRRFESLGSNCELGFVLAKAGVKDASMFRWTLIEDHDRLLSALEGDLEGLYEFENLTPAYATMVRDDKYGLCFHTAMKIVHDGEQYVFAESEGERRPVHAREYDKFQHFASTFLRRLEAPEKIYVYRSNAALPPAMVDALLAQLRKRSVLATLLIMRQADEAHPPGEVTLVQDRVYEGYLRYLSTSPALDDIDFDAWFETCGAAWRLHASSHGLPLEDEAGEQPSMPPSSPPPGFDGKSYLLANPDVAAAGVDAADHYLRHGWREGRPLA